MFQKYVPRYCACLLLLLASTSWAAEPTTIELSAADTGRAFEGIGGVSAGASTRLLYDYPEPYRSDILDFLFSPHFGVALQHLKVEIGSGDNSTSGSEPSHVITRAELAQPKARGYEFWLMKEARNRNPGVILDCLPWAYPGWITNRFSQDATDWFVAFLDVCRKQYELELDYVGAAQNEKGTDRDWIVNSVRPTLDARGYRDVKIQAPDDNAPDFWKIFDKFDGDPAYSKAVAAVSYHYVNDREPWQVDMPRRNGSTAKAKASGKPLWASEEWSTGGGHWDGVGAMYLARLINQLYIIDRITKTEFWAPIGSVYAGVAWEDTGLMQANSPWSGYYAVWPAVWAVAHTTQFAQPGWQYLDAACGQFDAKTWKGSYVTLKDPESGHWSMIVCTDGPAKISVRVSSGLKQGPVHVWHSSATDQFVNEDDVKVVDGKLAVSLEGNSIYSLTTTTGQKKGRPAHEIPPARTFPLPYSEDFESYAPGVTPRYLSDQQGTFEVFDDPGHGKCLKQIVPRRGISWDGESATPFTVFGDQKWSDYALKADVRITGGHVALAKRSCAWNLDHSGAWKLCLGQQTLASGKIDGFDAGRWHTMKVVYHRDKLRGYIDGKLLAEVGDRPVLRGMPCLASSYDGNMFDNVSVAPAASENNAGVAE